MVIKWLSFDLHVVFVFSFYSWFKTYLLYFTLIKYNMVIFFPLVLFATFPSNVGYVMRHQKQEHH